VEEIVFSDEEDEQKLIEAKIYGGFRKPKLK
jgi:hypothetical protein